MPLDEKIVFSFLFDDISLNVAVIDEPAMPTIIHGNIRVSDSFIPVLWALVCFYGQVLILLHVCESS